MIARLLHEMTDGTKKVEEVDARQEDKAENYTEWLEEGENPEIGGLIVRPPCFFHFFSCFQINALQFAPLSAFDVSQILSSTHNLLRLMAVYSPPSDRVRALVFLPFGKDVIRALTRHDRQTGGGCCEFNLLL